jgi:hypothetical protein
VCIHRKGRNGFEEGVAKLLIDSKKTCYSRYLSLQCQLVAKVLYTHVVIVYNPALVGPQRASFSSMFVPLPQKNKKTPSLILYSCYFSFDAFATTHKELKISRGLLSVLIDLEFCYFQGCNLEAFNQNI